MKIAETTSPLRAAREWRGISLAAAARNSGLPIAQAEALEEGRTEEFDTLEEMVAAAVLYGASLDVGRDEAMALLDRTISDGEGHPIDPPLQHHLDPGGSLPGYVEDVPIHGGDGRGIGPVPGDPGGSGEPGSELSEGLFPPAAGSQPMQGFVTPQTTAADWHGRDTMTGDVAPHSAAYQHHEPYGLTRRVSDHIADVRDLLTERLRPLSVRLREYISSSRHGALMVAIAVGVLIGALIVGVMAISGGGSAPPTKPAAGPTQAKQAPVKKKQGAGKAKAAKKTPAVMPRTALKLDVFNAGSVTGKANQVASVLQQKGYKMNTVGNSQSDYATSVILHAPGLRREAARLSKDTGITTIDAMPSAGTGGAKLVVVVV